MRRAKTVDFWDGMAEAALVKRDDIVSASSLMLGLRGLREGGISAWNTRASILSARINRVSSVRVG